MTRTCRFEFSISEVSDLLRAHVAKQIDIGQTFKEEEIECEWKITMSGDEAEVTRVVLELTK